MATLKLILQAAAKNNHAIEVRNLFNTYKPTQALLSIAFANEAGVEEIESALGPIAKRTKVFVGIRNGITSIQAIKRLRKLKISTFAVDTGSRLTIFHPKLYLACNATHAGAIIGSANLTIGGLHNNIELSTLLHLDLSVTSEREFVDEILSNFSNIQSKHPKHVFEITSVDQADKLLEEGRLVDESIVPAPSVGGTSKKGARDDLSPMPLWHGKRESKPRPKTAVPPASAAVGKAKAKAKASSKYLVWESKPLTERDLSIPKGATTNPTGSMGWKKGLLEGVDQRHHFRDEVFADLTWTPDAPPSKWERAVANFELIVKNVNHGTFALKLSHKTDKKSASYLQKNFMTQLHWGEAKGLIANSDLLGRTLLLYRRDSSPPEFTIEID